MVLMNTMELQYYSNDNFHQNISKLSPSSFGAEKQSYLNLAEEENIDRNVSLSCLHPPFYTTF